VRITLGELDDRFSQFVKHALTKMASRIPPLTKCDFSAQKELPTWNIE